MTLAQAEQVCGSFSAQPLLLPVHPTWSLCCRCRRKMSQKAPSLAPHCLHAQPSPDLAHQHCQLCLLTPPLPPIPTFQHKSVAKTGTGNFDNW